MSIFDRGGYKQPERHRRQSARHQLKKTRRALWLIAILVLVFAAVFAAVTLFIDSAALREKWLRFAGAYAGSGGVIVLICLLLKLIEEKVLHKRKNYDDE